MLLRASFQAHDPQLALRPETEYCLQCAVCGLVCVVNYAECYDPRRTFVYDLFAEGIEARQTLWSCPACHKCEERCPYDFKPLDLVRAHKEAAIAAGLAPKEVYSEFESVLSTGSAFPVSSVTLRQRAKLGLPDLPEVPVDELAVIAQHTGLTAKLEAALRLRSGQALRRRSGQAVQEDAHEEARLAQRDGEKGQA
jgi:heterodisulfide reductase subunit C